jgi:hypothetical protein
MTDLVQTIEFFGMFALAIEMGFETVFSIPPVEAYFKKHPARTFVKRIIVLGFCLVLCAVLYAVAAPEKGALFLERVFGQKVPVVDVVLTSLILSGGSRAVHELLKRVGSAASPAEKS